MRRPVAEYSRFGRFRSPFLAVLLMVALAVTGVVTYRAHIASKKHQQAVEQVISNFVEVASFQLIYGMREVLYGCAVEWLAPVMNGDLHISKVSLEACEAEDSPRFFYDLRSGVVQSFGGTLSGSIEQLLQDTLADHPTARVSVAWQLGFLVPDKSTTRELVVYAVESQDSEATSAFGVILSRQLDVILQYVLAQHSLFPDSFTRGATTTELLHVTLIPPGGADLVPSDKVGFPARAEFGPLFGGFALDVGLRPAALDRIVPGGLPRDRRFELLGLLGLATGLVMASLLLLQREAQLARTRADFVSGVSHELRTPLAQIRMFAEMLLLGRVRNDADRRRSLEIIDKEARRLSHMVENVLQIARSEKGTTRVNPTEMRMAPIIRETVESFTVLAEARRIEFRLELEERLVAPIDSAAMRQILLNLLDNAAKYGPEGQRVIVGLALFDNVARLWIDDEGPGIPARERARVFEPFYRARRDLQSAKTGSGIGLAVVRELAVLHGGTAWVEDAPERGARVVIEFPGAYLHAQDADGGWAVA